MGCGQRVFYGTLRGLAFRQALSAHVIPFIVVPPQSATAVALRKFSCSPFVHAFMATEAPFTEVSYGEALSG